MSTRSRLLAGAAVCAMALPGARSVSATTITEYFNGYGTDIATLLDLGAADGGWGSAWLNSDRPVYHPGVQLTLTQEGYSNAGNLTGSGDGAAGYGSIGNSGSKTLRTITAPGLGGTIWISALAQISSSVTLSESLFWLGGNGTNNYLAIRDFQGVPIQHFRYDGTTSFGAAVTQDVTHLLLARIQPDVNVDGHDTIDFWFDPDLSGGEAGLGVPTFTGSGASVFDSVDGNAFSGIQLSFNEAGSFIDAIRISNDVDGFTQVTNPSVMLLGDLDGDGFVGIADLNIILGNWNQNVTPGDPLQGDPSGDGFVGIEDLNEVLGNWNAGTPPSGGVVPEPSTPALLGMGGLALLRRRRV